MKKTFAFLTFAIAAILCCSSCVFEGNTSSGKVAYSIGFSKMEYHGASMNEALDEMRSIENAYKDQISKVPGVTEGGIGYEMEGKYSKCDDAIKDACKKAESTLAGKTFKGSYTFRVQATYYSGAEMNDNFYVKSFGD